jgi:hypothetical protein
VGEGVGETWKEGAKERKCISLAPFHMTFAQTEAVGKIWPTFFLALHIVLLVDWCECSLDILAEAEQSTQCHALQHTLILHAYHNSTPRMNQEAFLDRGPLSTTTSS